MDVKQIRQILKGTFSDPKDRKYWEDALKEAERHEANWEETRKRYPGMVKEFEHAAAKRNRETRAMLAREAKLHKQYMESAMRKK